MSKVFLAFLDYRMLPFPRRVIPLSPGQKYKAAARVERAAAKVGQSPRQRVGWLHTDQLVPFQNILPGCVFHMPGIHGARYISFLLHIWTCPS